MIPIPPSKLALVPIESRWSPRRYQCLGIRKNRGVSIESIGFFLRAAMLTAFQDPFWRNVLRLNVESSRPLFADGGGSSIRGHCGLPKFYLFHVATKDTRRRIKFEPVLARTPNENSVLTLEAPEKRESESSKPISRTLGRNLEGFTRAPKISIRTEIAASWATRAQKTHKSL